MEWRGDMDFTLGGADTAFVQSVQKLADKLGNDHVIERDAAGTFSREAWTHLAQAGLTGLPIPRHFGGQEASAITTVAALTQLGRICHDNGLLFGLGAHTWACADPIAAFGDDAQRKRWLPGLCDGTLIGAHAATEPDAGSDISAITTTASATPTGWVINGTKTFVTNGPYADVFLVIATTDPSRGALGLSAFVIARDTPGLMVEKATEKSGLRTVGMSDVSFQDCHVGKDALLGVAGAGYSIFTATMNRERTFILAPTLGVLQRLTDQCATRAKTRRQFGEPIASFQSVSHRIADMRVRAHTSWLLASWVAHLVDQQQTSAYHAAMVKLQLSESFLATALDAVQIYGGEGYTTQAELERMVRDAMGARIYSGTSDIQRNVIARGIPGNKEQWP